MSTGPGYSRIPPRGTDTKLFFYWQVATNIGVLVQKSICSRSRSGGHSGKAGHRTDSYWWEVKRGCDGGGGGCGDVEDVSNDNLPTA